MRGPKLAIDPLWECLCPAWNAVGSNVSKSALLRAVPKRPQQFTTRSTKHLSTTAAQRSFGRAFETPFLRPVQGVELLGQKPVQIETATSLYQNIDAYARKGHPDACRREVQKLVRQQGERPNIRMYNALILSNISPDRGAAWRVHKLVQEMQDEGLEPDQATCHNILKVLAVHPDHLLRTNIQRFMRDKWLTLTPEGHHDIAVGLLREGCFETALNSLDTMAREGIHAETWLLDMFAYMLSEAGEMDMVYRMVRSRWDNAESNMSSTLWYWLLDMASAARYYPLTEFAWRTQVELDFIQASSGMCYNIMSTASRAGDPKLATDVIKYIAQRGEKNTALHYQLLIEAYMSQTPDIEKALSVLGVMMLEKMQPTRWHTRSMFVHLTKSPQLVDETFRIIQRLRDSGKNVAVAAVNLIIECYAGQNDLESAMKVYKQMHTFSSKVFANTETFNLLLKACRTGTSEGAQQAGFLISEMLALRVEPDALTYDRLILVFNEVVKKAGTRSQTREEREKEHHLRLQYLDIACRYFNEIQSLNWRPRWGTLQELILSLASTGDARCWDLLQFADDNAVENDGWSSRALPFKREVEQRWQKVKEGLFRSRQGTTSQEMASSIV